MTEIAKLLKVI